MNDFYILLAQFFSTCLLQDFGYRWKNKTD